MVDGTQQVQVGWALALIGVVDVARQLQVGWAPDNGRWDTTGPSGMGPSTNWSGRWDTTGPSEMGP